MITSIVTWGSTLPIRVKLLMMWYGFIGRGMHRLCDQMKRREALELKEFSWLDLPSELLESIISKLPFEDEARMACVCKSWRDIIQTSPPFYPVGKSPLLLHVKSRGEEEEEEEGGKGVNFQYYSPLVNKAFESSYHLDLRGYEIISAIDGTLLIYSQDEMEMRMVDPLGGYSHDFPGITSNISFNGAAIGEHWNFYTIFLIDTSRENQVVVHFYKQGNWALDLVYDNGEEPFNMSSNPVYCDGRFYCLGTKGDRLGVFDSIELTWQVHNVEFMNKYDDDDDVHCRCCYYLVDWIHTVMAVRVRVENHGRRIHLFILDRKKMVWEETDDLRGRSLFLGSTLSIMSLPTAKMLRNRIFLPHFHQDETKTVIESIIVFWCRQFYFRSKSSISSKGKSHAATTTICCCNNSGEESLYLGSIQNQNYSTIWYQPFYNGFYNAKREEASVKGFSVILKMFPHCLICCLLLLVIYESCYVLCNIS